MKMDFQTGIWDPRFGEDSACSDNMYLLDPWESFSLFISPPAHSCLNDYNFISQILARFGSDKIGLYVGYLKNRKKFRKKLETAIGLENLSEEDVFVLADNTVSNLRSFIDLYRSFADYEYWYFCTLTAEDESEAKKIWKQNPDFRGNSENSGKSPFRLRVLCDQDVGDFHIAVGISEDFDSVIRFVNEYPLTYYPIILKSNNGSIYKIGPYELNNKVITAEMVDRRHFNAWDVKGRPTELFIDCKHIRARLTSQTPEPELVIEAMLSYAQQMWPSNPLRSKKSISDPLEMWELVETHLAKRGMLRKLTNRFSLSRHLKKNL